MSNLHSFIYVCYYFINATISKDYDYWWVCCLDSIMCGPFTSIMKWKRAESKENMRWMTASIPPYRGRTQWLQKQSSWGKKGLKVWTANCKTDREVVIVSFHVFLGWLFDDFGVITAISPTQHPKKCTLPLDNLHVMLRETAATKCVHSALQSILKLENWL